MEAARGNDRPRRLRHALSSWQIFFIVFTTVIGSGCFTDYGVAAKTAGPSSLLVATVIVGVIAVCAMEGLSEMIQLFPVVNPVVELVHHFLDRDLALCVGASYWYAYASFMPLQLIRAASYLNFFVDADEGGWLVAKVTLFYVILPTIILLINCLNVKVFGYIEAISGFTKIVLLLIIVLMLCQIAGAAGSAQYFTQDFISTLRGSHVTGNAICLIIESIAFSFLGIETIALTAYEAKSSKDLYVPSKFTAYVTFWCYILFAIATSLSIDWNSAPEIPTIVDQDFTVGRPVTPGHVSSTSASPIIAALKVNEPSLAYVMNAIFIFCAVSAANGTVYASSRMLYGMAQTNKLWHNEWVDRLATVSSQGVPYVAVLVSAASFCLWVPYTQIKPSETGLRLLSWFVTSGDICVFFMWGSVSLAYIRYWFIFRRKENRDLLKTLRGDKPKLTTVLSWAQPVPAFIGLLGSILIVWIFSSSIFWGRRFTFGEFVQYYSAPVVLVIVVLIQKAVMWNRNRSDDESSGSLFGELIGQFDDPKDLRRLIDDLIDSSRHDHPHDEAPQSRHRENSNLLDQQEADSDSRRG